MLAEGNVVYFGTPRNSLEYLRNVDLACPDGYNAADHWMDLLVRDTAIDESNRNFQLSSKSDSSPERTERTTTETVDGTSRSTGALDSLAEDAPADVDESKAVVGPKSDADVTRSSTIQALNLTTRERLIQAWDGEAIAVQMDLATRDETQEDANDKSSGTYRKYNTSWAMQYRVLVHRSLKNSRSAIFTPINLIKSAALGVVTGALWFQTSYTEANVYDLSSFFFFTMTYWVVSHDVGSACCINRFQCVSNMQLGFSIAVR